jgi:hypothetical protein
MDGVALTSPSPLALAGGVPNLPLVQRLTDRLAESNREYDRFDRYYTGDQPLSFMAPEIRAQIGQRLTPLVINWPEVIVDSVARRLSVEGFELGQGGEVDDELWRIWTANGMPGESHLAHIDTLVHGAAYLAVWGNDEDPSTPVISVESAHQVAVEYDPIGNSVRAALKRWVDGDRSYATLYLRDRIVRYVSTDVPVDGLAPNYKVEQILPNPLGVVPIVPLVNKGRLLNRSGRSELATIAPIADGINKLATDMLVTSEFYLTPRRYATGIQIPTGPDVERLRAEAAAYWDQATKGKTWLAGEGVNFGQFPEATMDGFVQGINLLTSAMAAIGGLPPDDLGLNQVNPASAEARRAAETVLILRGGEKQTSWGPSYVKALRYAVAARDGIPVAALPQEYSRMQTVWRELGTPAIAQTMDAAVKGHQEGIYDTDAAQQLVGLSPVQRAAIKSRRAEAADTAATADVRARMAQARELVATDGLTLNAAMAAVGLMQAASVNSAESAAPAALSGP